MPQSAQIVPVESALSITMQEVKEGTVFTNLQEPANRGEKVLVLARNKGTGRVILSVPSAELSITRHPGEFHWDKSQQRLVDEGGEPYACIGHYVEILPIGDQEKRAVALYETLHRYKGPDLSLTEQELEQAFKDEKNVLMVLAALAGDETRSLAARAMDCLQFTRYPVKTPFTPRETLLIRAAFSLIANAKEAETTEAMEEGRIKKQA